MDENKNNLNPSENNLSGFDSVSNITPKQNNQFNPTPMFVNMNPTQPKAGYSVTPDGNFHTSTPKATLPNQPTKPVQPIQGDIVSSKPDVPTPAEVKAPAPATSTTGAEIPKAEPQKAEVTKQESPVSQPAKPSAPMAQNFIPSGTYSYSSPKSTIPSPEVATQSYNKSDSNQIRGATNLYPTQPIINPSSNSEDGKDKKKEKKKHSTGVIIAAILLSAVIGAGSAFGGIFLYDYLNPNSATANELTLKTGSKNETNIVVKEEKPDPESVTNIIVNEDNASTAIEAVAKKAGPSIVGIRTTAAVSNFLGGSDTSTGEGSGIIYTIDGYIITNYHVIQSAAESSNAKVEVFLADDTNNAINATIIGYNISSDLAVVKIDKTNLTPIEFADSDKLSVGQYAIAIGNPGGIEFMGSVSYGIVSGLNRSITMETGNTMSLIQTDAAINPGNSGGALVDIEGKLIGVNSIKLVSEGYESMGFAIPSNTVKEICNSIIAKQNDPTPYIGLQISQNYTADQLKALGFPAGAVVIDVVEGGPASVGGIRRGDIITNFNGTEITGYASLENAISQCKPGDTVTVNIYRGGRYYSTTINIKANTAQ